MKVGIYGQSNNEITIKYVNELVDLLASNGISFVFEENFYEGYRQISDKRDHHTFAGYEDLDASYDFLFSVGGDGTFLRSVTFIRDRNIPIIGINTGTLGFLAIIQKEHIDEAIDQLLKGQYAILERPLLRVSTNDKEIDFGGMNFALNEVAVSRKDTASMIRVETFLDDEFLTTYWSDGLIISTSTGSTGYSLSCGGPIISPSSKNLVLTPIAPHSLSVRPLVIPLQTEIELHVDSRSPEALLTLDSRMYTISNRSRIHIRQCDFSVKTVRLKDQTFIRTLREKLLWGEDKRN